jgi:FkbM family methyltransferase
VSILRRAASLLARRRRARRLGFRYQRAMGFQPPPSVLVLGEHRPLSLPSESFQRVAFADVLLDDAYGLERLPRELETVLDIGANAGLFGIAARNAFPRALIHAYEPNAALEPYLRRQAAAADFRYFLAAVGAHDARAVLSVPEGDSGQARATPGATGPVEMVGLARALQRLRPDGPIDLVKADCAGAEWALLEAATAWARVRHAVIEYRVRDPDDHAAIRRRLEELGFAIRGQVRAPVFATIRASRSVLRSA